MKAVFAGSFDPFTEGHAEIVKSAAKLFSEVVVAVAHDTGRAAALDANLRAQIASASLNGLPDVRVEVFSGLLIDFLRKENCRHLVRGLRDSNDFLYEQTLSTVYQSQNPDLVPVYFFPPQAYRHVSGTIVRELARLDGNLDGYVAKSAQELVKKAYQNH